MYCLSLCFDHLRKLLKVNIFVLIGETKRMNLFQSLTNAMDIALETDSTAGMFFKVFCSS